MAKIDYEKCIDLANKRLRDVITAANKADPCEMEALMMSSMCGDITEFTDLTGAEQTELTLSGDCKEGIYFRFQGIYFHITKDSEYNCNRHSDLYHIWCTCDYFDGEDVPMSHVYVNWLCGGDFLEEKHKEFLNGEISKQAFEQYIWNDVNIRCSDWLEKNRELIHYE